VNNFPFLSVLTVAPAVGALVVALLPRSNPRLAKIVALVWSLALLAITAVMCVTFQANGPRFQFRESYPWIPAWGIRLTVQADGIALVMLGLVAVLVPIVIAASWHDAEKTKRSVNNYFALLLALDATMIGVFAAADVFLFYAFFEVMLIPMYFLIGSFGGARRQYAAVKFFLYSLFGGLFMLAAVIGLWVVGGHTLDWNTLSHISMSTSTGRWLFLGFFLAFAIKAPFFPFHTWLPDAGGAAPAGAAALLVGVLDKVGTYGILRFCFSLFPEATRFFAPLGLALAVVGIIYGSLLAVGQNDLKRLVAYTSIAHFGFIGIGIFAFTSQAGTGAVLYMLNHGLSTGALFLIVGMLVQRRGSANIRDFGGAAKLVPVLAGCFLVVGFSSLALPGTSPFVSEFLVLLGTFSVHKALAIVATSGVILAAGYILWMYQRTMQGKLNPELSTSSGFKHDLTGREKWVVAPLIALIFILGVYPKPVIDVISPAVAATMHDVGKSDPVPATRAVDNGSGGSSAVGDNK
jgi:NADH-quinone oxidoreductase subunit M